MIPSYPYALLGVLVTAILWLISIWKYPNISNKWRLMSLLLFLGIFIFIEYQNQTDQKEHREQQEVFQEQQRYAGKFRSGKSNILNNYHGTIRVRVPGTKNYVFTMKNVMGKDGVVRLLGPKSNVMGTFNREEPVLTFYQKNGKLIFSSVIRNDRGNIVAEIIENEWNVNKDNSYERNYSDTALEVLAPDGDIALQVRVKKRYLELGGTFHNKDGDSCIKFDYEKMPNGEINPKLGHMVVNASNCENHLNPIFKYPSELHLNETSD